MLPQIRQKVGCVWFFKNYDVMAVFRHVFFDLDHTLWDFEKCAHETLEELFVEYRLEQLGINHLPTFLNTFTRINKHLWQLYDQNQISKEEIRKKRFPLIFESLGIKNVSFLADLEREYLFRCPQKPYLIPHSIEILSYLHKKGSYHLHVITNGFADVQHTKMKSSKIDHFFKHIITSECSGYKKPDKQMFEFAFQRTQAHPSEAIMIGDNLETDIRGALETGMTAVFFNPQKTSHQTNVHYEINCLLELKAIL